MLQQKNICFIVANALAFLLMAGGQEPTSETPPEMLLNRVRRFDARMRNYKRDPKYRFQFTRVNVSLNQQTRFLTKYGPYIVKLHLYLDKGLESRMNGNTGTLIMTAKKVVNFANTLLRPLNTYIMVSSTHIPSKHISSSPDFPDGDILTFLNNDYVYHYFPYMFEEVINCVFVFLGRNHMNYSLSDSSGNPCDEYHSRPKCKGFVTLETNRSNYIKTAGVALAHEISHRVGAGHDTGDKCQCKFNQCLMDEYVTTDGGSTPIGWSTCSISSVADGLDSLALGKACLSAKWNSKAHTDGHSIIAEYSTDWGVSCGNGIMEPGEECDCGGPLACKENRCCRGDVCKLSDGAACGTGDCCNTTSCTPLAEGTLCRLAEDHRCDFPEFCDGVSTTCPLDVSVLPDWPCDTATGYRCRLRHCLPPRKGAKYTGPKCEGDRKVPTSAGECKPEHNPGPAERIEEWIEPSVESSTAEEASKKPAIDFGELDQKGRQLRSISWLVATSAALLPALLISSG